MIALRTEVSIFKHKLLQFLCNKETTSHIKNPLRCELYDGVLHYHAQFEVNRWNRF